MLKSVVKVFRPINSAPSTKMQFGIYHRFNRLFNLAHFKFINPLSIAYFSRFNLIDGVKFSTIASKY